jgi:8-oxo-dGTP pyrophosphatase MutT (NUDIX family)
MVVQPQDAATVMLVRDAPGLEVFMLRRNLRSEFAGGAYVFPGGRVDPEDRQSDTLARVHGLDDAVASARLGMAGGALGFWVAAIRESFEEAGVLLARGEGTGAPVDVEREAADDVAALRGSLAAGDITFLDVVRALDVVLDAGALAPFARWITPKGGNRRYDTWFFLAAAPEGHAYRHDDAETVASTWVRPADALERARRGEIDLIYPTFRSLLALSHFARASEVLEAVGAVWRDDPEPLAQAAANGWQVKLPGDDPSDAHDDARLHSTLAGGFRSLPDLGRR